MRYGFFMCNDNEDPAVFFLGKRPAGCIFSPEVLVKFDDRKTKAPKNLGMVEIDEDGAWYPCEYRIKGVMHASKEQMAFMRSVASREDD